jgi:hypothetical protein
LQPIGVFIIDVYGARSAKDPSRVEAVHEKHQGLYDYHEFNAQEQARDPNDDWRDIMYKNMGESARPLLQNKLFTDFYKPGVPIDALRLQAATRIGALVTGDIHPDQITPPRVFAGDPPELQEIQAALARVYNRRQPGGAPDAEGDGHDFALARKTMRELGEKAIKDEMPGVAQNITQFTYQMELRAVLHGQIGVRPEPFRPGGREAAPL